MEENEKFVTVIPCLNNESCQTATDAACHIVASNNPWTEYSK
jgi:hypothetical protein